nr:ABC transporter permease [Clostridia bacterium]
NEEDTLDLFVSKELRIVGTVDSPYYANFERGSTSLGSGKIAGFAYVRGDVFDMDYYTEIFLRLRDMPATGTESYRDAADAAKGRLEDLLKQRGDIRYTSLKEEADEKIADAQAQIDDGWAKIADGKQEIEDAEKKLADARQELADGRKELDDGWAELAEAQQELDDARKELDDAKIELEDARKELDDGWAQYNDGLQEYEDALEKYEDGLSDYKAGRDEAQAQLAAASEQLEQAKQQLAGLRAQLDDAIDQKDQLSAALPLLPGEEQAAAVAAIETLSGQIAYGEAQYAAGMDQYEAGKADYDLNAAAVDKQLSAARSKLSDARRQLDDAKIELEDALIELEDGEKEYADGLAEYEDGLAEYQDGLEEVEDAKKELEDGEKEYADGLAEYEEKSADAEKTIADAKQDIADAEIDLTEGQQKVDDAKKDLEDLKEPTVYVLGREANAGYAALENDTAIVKGIAKVFPLFFFLVAMLVCITTMTRMVDEQRTEDGTLKALGFNDAAIAGRYLIYASSASLLGSFTGFFVGSKFMPMAIWKIYRIMYSIARPVAFVLDWKMFALCTAMYILCAFGSTLFVIHRELQEAPAELIRPEAPMAGKRVLLEKLPFIWKRLNFLRKVSVRNIFLYKKRMFMMILGIGGCTALLLTGFGIRDSISKIVDYQYEEINIYDGAVTFSEGLDEADERAFFKEFADVVEDAAFASVSKMDTSHQGASEEANIVVFSEPLNAFIDLHEGDEKLAWPGMGETVINYRLARDLGVSAGDTITIVDGELRRMDLRVTGVYDNYLYDFVYVS